MHTENRGMRAAVANLKAAAGVLLGSDPGGLSDQALLDIARELRPVACQVQAAEARIVAAIHTRGAASVEGAVSTAAWLRNDVHMPNPSARIRAAMVLQRLPQVAAAFGAGQIDATHVDAIAQAARDISDEHMAAGTEALLVEQAKELAPTKFVQAARTIRDHLAPDAADRRRGRHHTDRWLQANPTSHGAVSVNGVLDSAGGETLLAALAAFMPAPQLGDIRSTATRRADALIDLCRLAANTSLTPSGEKPAPRRPRRSSRRARQVNAQPRRHHARHHRRHRNHTRVPTAVRTGMRPAPRL